jgi:hypothetical protein
LDRLEKFAIVPSGHIESLRNLTESAARFYRQKEEFDDIPDEFLGTKVKTVVFWLQKWLSKKYLKMYSLLH